MKRHLFLMLILASLIISFTSCKKSSSSSSNSASNLAAGTSQINFDYSGAISGSFASSPALSKPIKNSSLYNINGGELIGSTPYSVLLLMDASTAAGTYNFKTISSSSTFAFSFSSLATGYTASPGDDFTLIITKNDGAVVEGTFSGTLKNGSQTITVTNGKLAAKF